MRDKEQVGENKGSPQSGKKMAVVKKTPSIEARTQASNQCQGNSNQGTVIHAGAIDMRLLRENINNLVGNSATEIAIRMIEAAKEGHLATVKYLFEAIGLYPVAKEAKPEPLENSSVSSLLKRIGMATESAICDDNRLRNDLLAEGRETTAGQ